MFQMREVSAPSFGVTGGQTLRQQLLKYVNIYRTTIINPSGFQDHLIWMCPLGDSYKNQSSRCVHISSFLEALVSCTEAEGEGKNGVSWSKYPTVPQ